MTTEDEVMEAAPKVQRVVLEKMLDPAPTRLPDHLKICSSCGELKDIESLLQVPSEQGWPVGPVQILLP